MHRVFWECAKEEASRDGSVWSDSLTPDQQCATRSSSDTVIQGSFEQAPKLSGSIHFIGWGLGCNMLQHLIPFGLPSNAGRLFLLFLFYSPRACHPRCGMREPSRKPTARSLPWNKRRRQILPAARCESPTPWSSWTPGPESLDSLLGC